MSEWLSNGVTRREVLIGAAGGLAPRAIENQLYLAYCNHAGVEHGMRFLGGSCLIGMDGKAVVAAGAEVVRPEPGGSTTRERGSMRGCC